MLRGMGLKPTFILQFLKQMVTMQFLKYKFCPGNIFMLTKWNHVCYSVVSQLYLFTSALDFVGSHLHSSMRLRSEFFIFLFFYLARDNEGLFRKTIRTFLYWFAVNNSLSKHIGTTVLQHNYRKQLGTNYDFPIPVAQIVGSYSIA